MQAPHYLYLLAWTIHPRDSQQISRLRLSSNPPPSAKDAAIAERLWLRHFSFIGLTSKLLLHNGSSIPIQF